MKIIYTSLQENDGGIERRATQLRIDFGGSASRAAYLAQGGMKQRSGYDNGSLLSRSGSPDGRPCPAGSESTLSEEKDGRRARNPQEDPCLPPKHGKSIAHILVRRFVEAERRSACDSDCRCRINITV